MSTKKLGVLFYDGGPFVKNSNKKTKPKSSKSTGLNSNDFSSANEENGYCTEYIHYKTGKLMKASDYGYKCWIFSKKKGA